MRPFPDLLEQFKKFLPDLVHIKNLTLIKHFYIGWSIGA
jgi:hypothetical protein